MENSLVPKHIQMIKYFVVDAFADELFSGNQAGVCVLDRWLDDKLMQNIAAENNLAETAFVVKKENGYELRWFTPEVEIDLCGHATLATAYIISTFFDKVAIKLDFHTKSGVLTVIRKGELYEMNFPARKPEKWDISSLMKDAIKSEIKEAWLSRDLLLLLDNEEAVLKVSPNLDIMKNIPEGFGLIVTAKGKKVDFVSRFFVPKAGIPEDPVTGSSHSTLIPFWAERLGKSEMIARQLSKRGGTLYCENHEERVTIAGYAKLYLEGEIKI